ncbi:MAG: NepR family anti-sigma factor [Novosphingobium sp.]
MAADENNSDIGGGSSRRAPGKRSDDETAMRRPDPIAAALRRLHDEVVAEPLPADFLEMLDRIDEKRSDGE